MYITARNVSLRTETIKIPRNFLLSPPKEENLRRHERRWNETGKLEKIYVDKNYWLVDGYISYLIAKNNGQKNVRGVVLSIHKGDAQPPRGVRIGRLHITWRKEDAR